MKNTFTVKSLCLTSILGALSLVLYVFGPKFSLPIFPSFLEVNFSMLPIFIALFLLDWRHAALIVIIRSGIKCFFSHTMCIGEASDLIIGLTVVLLTALISNLFKNNKHKLLITYLFSILSWILGGVLANAFSLPLYIKVFHLNYHAFEVLPLVNENNFVLIYFLFGVIPFNLMTSIVVGLITYLLNLRLKPLYDSIEFKNRKKISSCDSNESNDNKDLNELKLNQE
jgi:riboflavin transporter FmnP